MGIIRSIKKLRPGQHVIRIDTDAYIERSDITNRWEGAVKIDFLLAPATTFWQALEINCVAGCCGFNAFDFLPDKVVEASEVMDIDELRKTLAEVLHYLRKSPIEVLGSDTFNEYLQRDEWLELVRHIAWYVDRPEM